MYFLEEVIKVTDGFSCGGADVLRVIKFIFTLIDAILFIVPMGLIIMLSVDLFKNVIASKDDQMKKNVGLIIKRILYCVMLFLINPIVTFTMDFAGQAGMDFFKCVTIAKTEDLSKYTIEFEEDDFSDREQPDITGGGSYDVTTGTNSSSTAYVGGCGGPYKGQTYDLTEEQLNGLANAVANEQGTLIGRAAEASIMANLFEKKGTKHYGEGGRGLVNYVKTGGWFSANTKKAVSKTDSADPETVEVVRDVLVNGNRTIPLYIDEHDWFGDIDSATNNGTAIKIKDRSAYQKDVTIIDNKYGSLYTFFCFPDDKSDPFGYTKK